MGKASLFLILASLIWNPVALATDYKPAQDAALTALFIQTGLKDRVNQAKDLAKNKAKRMGLGPVLTLGMWSYSIGVKGRIKFKTKGFTFEGTNDVVTLTYSFSF